jgi:hypothetical protein
MSASHHTGHHRCRHAVTVIVAAQEGIIEFPEREQTGIGDEFGTMEFQLQAAIKFDP